MCVIIHKPAKKGLHKDRLQRLWKQNPDGGGFAFINPGTGKLESYKALDWHNWWPLFRDANQEFGNKVDFLVHMRIATHGKICIENTHPFQVDEHTYMAHNGIFSDFGGWGKDTEIDDKSDTRRFIEEIVQELPPTWLDSYGLRAMFTSYLGHSNKVAFLTNNPKLEATARVFVFNSKAGTTVDGMWFSNSSAVHKPIRNLQAATRSYSESWDYGTSQWRPEPKPPTPTKLGAKPATIEGRTVTVVALKAIEGLIIARTGDEILRLNTRYVNLGLQKPISKQDGYWFCVACDEALDPGQFYYCACYDRVCEDCFYYSSDCHCDFGIPRITMDMDEFRTLCIDMFGEEEGGAMQPNETDEDSTVNGVLIEDLVNKNLGKRPSGLQLTQEDLDAATALGIPV